ncbi:MAG: protein translocase subunit SecD [Thermoflexaceae bacterium]|nr:protein translocase subunit SecD [Thermoflexaceae bacterium]
MKTGKKIICLLVLIIALGGLGYITVCGIGADKYGSASDIKLGLDLAGGVSITYTTVEENPSRQDMDDTVYRLQKRVENYSSEAEVYQEGDNRINVEIPDVTDANAILEELGQPGSLIFMDTEGNVIITGNDIKSAEAQAYKDNNGTTQYVVSLELNDSGKSAFGEATTRLVAGEDSKRYIYIIYNNEIISAPYVKSAITEGSVMIDNMQSLEYAETLASTIRIGAIPLELTELRSNVVGAKLGQDAIKTSLKAGAIGLVLLFIFMIIVYRIPGLAASLALALYTMLMIFLISIYDITLTLPGIAGIILSIGMAVDANVIIFARIREELMKGKAVKSSIKDGSAKALSAILDGNITTLIAAAVLAFKGSGTVKGFASTLALGTVVSMFTALIVTKFILNLLYELGFKKVVFYGIPKERKTINFVGVKNICFAISAVIIIAGFVFMGVNSANGKGAFNYSLEFVGGTTTSVTFNEQYTQADVESIIIPVIKEATGVTQVQQQTVNDSNQVIFKTVELTLEQREAFTNAMVTQFGVDAEQISAENISATVSSEMKSDAVVAIILATICMLLYIWFRFSSLSFAGAAVLALIHDVLIVIGFYAVSRISLGNTFIACVLTIVGYSINATIVVFDRIRENLKNMPKAERGEIVNVSITQTLGRSINTSLTTFVMVMILAILGVSSIREFAIPIMVGVVCGAYSSVFLAGTFWYVFSGLKKKEN